MLQILKDIMIVLMTTLVFASCHPGIPNRYLQPDEMANILYDYHLAEGIQSLQQKDDSIAMRAYRISILKKYGVTSADFDSSMVYYTRHTELLEKVYKNITDRLDNESAAYGGQMGMADNITNSSDTTNIWRGPKSLVLPPYNALNRYTFEMKADTSYHDGDQLMMDFDTQFIYQDGMRDAYAVLAVTYANDSVEVVSNPISSSTHYHMQINNYGRLKIKSVRGFMIHNNSSSIAPSSLTTIKLLVIKNISIIRMHTKPSKQENNGQSESQLNHDSSTVVTSDTTSRKITLRKLTPRKMPIR